MPFLSAQKIHDGHGWLPDDTIIEVSDDNTILSVKRGPKFEARYFDGILAPGFVNAHCHLELSHMKGLGAEHTGLIPFLKDIPLHRNDFTDKQKKIARLQGYKELVRNGVVAVGDISNTTDALDIRALDELHFHSFIETIGFTETKAQRFYDNSVNTYSSYAAQQQGKKILKQSIVPHAPYSVSTTLFRLIDGHSSNAVISVHNQECDDENRYYIAKDGHVSELLQLLGIDDSYFKPSGKPSLQTYLEWMSPDHTYILVHNTCSTKYDVRYAQSRMRNVFWCLCPNANLYIENTLPDIDMFISEGENICIGTDSLASNHQLSVLSELLTIKEHFPHIGWETLLTWATSNGARALQMQDTIGTIEPGKKPGIIHISGFDKIFEKPHVERII